MVRSGRNSVAATLGRMVRRATTLIAVAASFACSEEDLPTGVVPTGEAGRVRFVHAVADPSRADRVNVSVAGVPIAVNVAFGAVVPNTSVQPNPATYYPIYTGAATVSVRRTSDTTVKVLDQALTVAAGTDYTVLAIGSAATVSGVVLTDDNSAPTAGNIRLRAVHASPSAAPSVDVYITAAATDIGTVTPTASNVAFRGASAYVTLPSGVYRVRVTAAGSKTPILDVTTASLAAGTVRSFFILDRAAGGTPLTNAFVVDR